MELKAVEITRQAKETGMFDALWKAYEQVGIHIVASTPQLAREAFVESAMRPIQKEICRVIYQDGLVILTSGECVFGNWCEDSDIGPTNVLIGVSVFIQERVWALSEELMSDEHVMLLERAREFVDKMDEPITDGRLYNNCPKLRG